MAAITAPCAVSPVRRPRAATARPAAPQRAGGREAGSSVHLTRRGRVVVALAALLGVLAGVLALVVVLAGPAAPSASASSTAVHPAVHTIVVQPGQTLWSIAARIAPKADPRETITMLREVNNLTGPSVYAGQRLIIPAAS